MVVHMSISLIHTLFFLVLLYFERFMYENTYKCLLNLDGYVWTSQRYTSQWDWILCSKYRHHSMVNN